MSPPISPVPPHKSLGLNNFANFRFTLTHSKSSSLWQQSGIQFYSLLKGKELLRPLGEVCLPTHYWQTVTCQFSQHPVLQTIEQCLQVTILSLAASLILSCLPGTSFSPSHVFLQLPWTQPICKCPVQESELLHTTASQVSISFFHSQDKVLLKPWDILAPNFWFPFFHLSSATNAGTPQHPVTWMF